ncbi:MAG: TetR family transcriptional regulator [Kiritimatiellae bacterium]|nr:TetR family transcriptional regulator [Kiritimatiellia bacterium]
MARKRKEDAEKTRRRILASALSLFVRKGYERTTFTDIAARLKMTKGAVYWHFESKERLLVELVEEALAKFRRQLDEMMPTGELTFPAVADVMIKNAMHMVVDPKSAEFFRLMKCQIKWSDDSMAKVREDLLANENRGPMSAFRNAVAADIAAGRARAEVDADEVAVVSIAIWDGLVQARIDHFLTRDLEQTLRHAYEAIWNRIRIKESKNG